MIKLKRFLMKRGLKLIAAIFLASLTAITLTTCGGGGGGSGDGGGGSSNSGGGGGGGGGTTDLMSGAVPPPDTVPQTVTMQYVTEDGTTIDIEAIEGWVIVHFDSTVSANTAENLILNNGGKIIAKVPNAGFYVAEVASGSEMSFIDKMKQESSVDFAEPDFLLSKFQYVTNPNEGVGERFYLSEIEVPLAWGLLSSKTPYKKVDIGIIDTGFYGLDKGLQDFGGRLSASQQLLQDPPENGEHGTIVTAIASAIGNNNEVGKNLGVNWNSNIYIDRGFFASINVYAIYLMVSQGVEVINISMGYTVPYGGNNGQCDFGERFFERMYIKNLVKGLNWADRNGLLDRSRFLVVIAAGNDDCDLGGDLGDIQKPDNLIIVGGSENGTISTGSNKGGLIDIAAPYKIQKYYSYGTQDYLDTPCGTDTLCGTSVSAPLVAGAAALVWAYDPNLTTSQEVIQRLKNTASGSIADFGGAGVLDVYKAIGGNPGDLIYSVTSNPSTGDDAAYSIARDSTYMYVVGEDSSTGNYQWRIEKRNLSDGQLVTGFGTNGVVTSNPSTGNDLAYSITIDSTYMYVVGADGGVNGDASGILRREALQMAHW